MLLCTGKIYYELDKERDAREAGDVAILRLEQLYPLGPEYLEEQLKFYAEGAQVIWVQEEPENMGAWRHVDYHYGNQLRSRFKFSGVFRPASASPATGSASSHRKEQETLISEAFDR